MVENPNVSKKVKSAFFTHTILTKISSLFSRKEEIELNERGKMIYHFNNTTDGIIYNGWFVCTYKQSLICFSYVLVCFVLSSDVIGRLLPRFYFQIVY